MNVGAVKAVTWIGGITIAVSSLLILSGQNPDATIGAGLIPARMTGILPLGIDFGPLTLPAWLTPLSHLFIHGDFLHLGFNMLMFFYLGRLVEQALGGRLLVVLYILSGLAGGALSVAASPAGLGPNIGASGAVSGILATYALLYSDQQVRRIGFLSANLVRALWFGAAWIGIQLLVGVASTAGAQPGEPVVGIMSHIGGFIAGLALTRPLLRYRFGRYRPSGNDPLPPQS